MIIIGYIFFAVIILGLFGVVSSTRYDLKRSTLNYECLLDKNREYVDRWLRRDTINNEREVILKRAIENISAGGSEFAKYTLEVVYGKN